MLYKKNVAELSSTFFTENTTVSEKTKRVFSVVLCRSQGKLAFDQPVHMFDISNAPVFHSNDCVFSCHSETGCGQRVA